MACLARFASHVGDPGLLVPGLRVSRHWQPV